MTVSLTLTSALLTTIQGPYGDDSEDWEGPIHEDAGDEEWQQALSIGGLSNSLSKGDLATLIHQGARAILQTQVLESYGQVGVHINVLR